MPPTTFAPQYADAYAPSRLEELNACSLMKQSTPTGGPGFASYEIASYWTPVSLLRSWSFNSMFSPEDCWNACELIVPAQPQVRPLNVYEFFGPTTYVRIPAQLMRITDETAINVLAANPRLVHYASTLFESTYRELESMGLSANWLLTTFSDPEDTRGKRSLFLECLIRGKSYSEILKIWDALSLKVFAHLTIEAQKEIALVLDEA